MIRTGGILALDLSSKTGWAYGVAGDPKPMSGVWELPNISVSEGRFFAAYENCLLDALGDYQPSMVSMEANMPAHQQTHAMTALQQIGLAVMTHSACYRWEKKLVSRTAGKVRYAVIGQGNIPKREVKTVVMAWCHARGWYPTDHNAGDALVVWAYEAGIRASRQKVRHVTPLLERAGA